MKVLLASFVVLVAQYELEGWVSMMVGALFVVAAAPLIVVTQVTE